MILHAQKQTEYNDNPFIPPRATAKTKTPKIFLKTKRIFQYFPRVPTFCVSSVVCVETHSSVGKMTNYSRGKTTERAAKSESCAIIDRNQFCFASPFARR